MNNMITHIGYSKLKEKLNNLHTERKSLFEEMKEVQDNCLSSEDLSEIYQYRSALDAVETSISNISEALTKSKVVDVTTMSTDKVRFGHSVEVEDMDSGEKKKYSLVSVHESDPKNGFISILSPLGKSLCGMEIGDVIEFNAPNGAKEYEVLSIESMSI